MALAQEGSPTSSISAVERPRQSYVNPLVTVVVATGIAVLTLGWTVLLVRVAVWLIWR